MAISKEHNAFIDAVAKGVDFKTAYATQCNPNATDANCKSQGSRLAKKYALEIQQAKEKAQEAIQQARDSNAVKEALNDILSQAEVDAILSDFISGKKFKVTVTDAFGNTHDREITPSLSERRAAIETYNKRFGSNEAEKKKIEIEDKRTTIKLSNGSEIDLG